MGDILEEKLGSGARVGNGGVSRSGTSSTPPVVINPTEYPGWDSFLAVFPESSVFHGAAWARVLQTTYGHRPLYFCGWEREKLTALLPVMEVRSPWFGKRGVALPFTDFCRPLGEPSAVRQLYQAAMDHGRRCGWRYLECRGTGTDWPGASPSVAFYGHVVNLATEPLDRQFSSPVRRGIRKAKAAGLRVEFGQTPEAMSHFYRLHCLTRRRHGVPPQPVRFFENISRYLLAAERGFVATAWHGKAAVAAAVFLVQGREAVYKFGASDYGYQQLRPNNLLMTEALHRCAQSGCVQVHLGRTSRGNDGLRRFKLAFGAREEDIIYSRFDFAAGAFVTDADRSQGWCNHVFRCLPMPMLRWVGGMLYPHLS